ncbi:MAG: aspartate aminotransferase family protein [Chloroflexi bacterium]|nr:aspartate aminotransferase family protein [Chloroflexota bacterium]
MTSPKPMYERPHVPIPPPGPKSRALLEKEKRLLYSAWSADKTVPFILKAKRGWLLEDVDGNRYLDMVTGWASTPLGARYEPVLKASVEALWESGGVECVSYITDYRVLALAEKLIAIAPPNMTRVAPDTTGTEAVEASLRLARAATGRYFIITFHGSFHGGNYTAGTAGPTSPDVGKGLREYVHGFIHVPYPTCYRCPFGQTYPQCGLTCLRYIEDVILRYEVAPEQIAGVLFEPIQGENGVQIPPDEWMQGLYAMAQKYGWVLIDDEVQTGFGRTGKMWAIEHWPDVQVDLMPLAKSLSGGALPIAAVLGTEETMTADDELYLGGTFAWQPAACAGALAGIEALEQERVLENVAELERIAREVMLPWRETYALVGDVRIKGTYIAVEFVRDRERKTPAVDEAAAIHQTAVRKGLVGIYENGLWWIRLLPALNMPPELFRHGLTLLEEAIADVERRAA